ncbi:MAG: hypothetical protein ACREO0_08815 [Pseudoxanthomonas sp.]
MSAQLQGRLSGWWAAWKYVVILLVLLAGSISLNVWQWKRAITAPYRAQVEGLEHAAKQAVELATAGQERERKALDTADQVAGTLQQAGKDYRQAIAKRPLAAQCAPGPQRVDAVNKTLGSSSANSGESHVR